MNLRPVVAALSLLVLSTGCPGPSPTDGGTGGGGGGTGGGTGSIPLDQLCTTLSTSLCDLLIRCQAVHDRASCTAMFDTTQCAVQQVNGIDAGRVRYDGAKAAECIASVESGSCATFDFDIPQCDATFVGLVPSGGLCNGEIDCVPGDFCSGNGLACGGTCKAKTPVGQPVMSGDRCVDDASPVNGVCTAGLSRGAECSNPDGGFETLPCSGSAYCQRFAAADGGARRVCAASVGVVGGACRDPDAGVGGCGSFSWCNSTTGLCTAIVVNGASCTPDRSNDPCQFDTYCNTGVSPSVCTPKSSTGGACISDPSCIAGTCDGGVASRDGGVSTVGVCLALPGLNQPCRGRCAADLYCDVTSGTCLALKANGASCVGGQECASGECHPSRDGGPETCGPCH